MMNLSDMYDITTDDAENYQRAFDYLHLHYDPKYAQRFVLALKTAKPVYKKLEDVLRAAGLRMSDLPELDEAKVKKEFKDGKKLFPVLLIAGMPLFICNGLENIARARILAPDQNLICKVTTGGR